MKSLNTLCPIFTVFITIPLAVALKHVYASFQDFQGIKIKTIFYRPALLYLG